MAPLTDPDRLAAYRDAFANWRFEGFVRFELTGTAYRWVKVELEGITLKELGRLIHEFVAAAGEIDEVRETRPDWRDEYEYHYDLRLAIHGKPVYIETRLTFELPLRPDCSVSTIVNVHAP